MRPRASIQRAAPYVHQLTTVRTVLASTAPRARGSSGGGEGEALVPPCQDAAPGLDLHSVGREHGKSGGGDPRRRDRECDMERAELRPIACDRAGDEAHDRQRDEALSGPEPPPWVCQLSP